MESIINYFIEFYQVTMYSIVLSLCFIYSTFVDKDFKQSVTLLVISIFFILSPYIRIASQDLILFKGDIGFFIFYSCYELILLIVLTLINYNEKRMYPLYFIHLFGLWLNWWCSQNWLIYPELIYNYYQDINRLMMDYIIIVIVSLTNKRRAVVSTVMVLTVPYIVKAIIT